MQPVFYKNIIIMRTKILLQTFLLSAITSIIICPLNACHSLAFICLAKAVVFYFIAYFVFTKYIEKLTIGIVALACIVCLGAILPTIPVRLIDFSGTVSNLYMEFIVIVSIFLAMLCYRDKRPAAFALSVIVMILLCHFGSEAWNSYIESHNIVPYQ